MWPAGVLRRTRTMWPAGVLRDSSPDIIDISDDDTDSDEGGFMPCMPCSRRGFEERRDWRFEIIRLQIGFDGVQVAYPRDMLLLQLESMPNHQWNLVPPACPLHEYMIMIVVGYFDHGDCCGAETFFTDVPIDFVPHVGRMVMYEFAGDTCAPRPWSDEGMDVAFFQQKGDNKYKMLCVRRAM